VLVQRSCREETSVKAGWVNVSVGKTRRHCSVENITASKSHQLTTAVAVTKKCSYNTTICRAQAFLVYGSVCSIVDFIKARKQQNDEIGLTHIAVKIDNIPQPVKTERESCTLEVLKCVLYTCKQFPVCLSTALALHTSQGLSLKMAIIDAGSNIFVPGMI